MPLGGFDRMLYLEWTRGVPLKGRSSDAGWLGFVVGLSSYDPRAGACPSAHSESPIWVMSKIRPSGPRGAGPRLLTNPYKSVNIVLATIDGVGRAPWFPSRRYSGGPIELKLLTFEYSVAALEGSPDAPLAEQPPPWLWRFWQRLAGWAWGRRRNSVHASRRVSRRR